MSVMSPAGSSSNERRTQRTQLRCACSHRWWTAARSIGGDLRTCPFHIFHILFDSIYLILSMLVGGWNIFIFPYIGKNHPNWLSFFSDGLKPPASMWFLSVKRLGDFSSRKQLDQNLSPSFAVGSMNGLMQPCRVWPTTSWERLECQMKFWKAQRSAYRHIYTFQHPDLHMVSAGGWCSQYTLYCAYIYI